MKISRILRNMNSNTTDLLQMEKNTDVIRNDECRKLLKIQKISKRNSTNTYRIIFFRYIQLLLSLLNSLITPEHSSSQ